MHTNYYDFLAMDPGVSESILNSLRDQLCLIDTAGVIRFVNKEWIRFAKSNGGTLASSGIGVNYLQQCKEEDFLYQGLIAILERRKDLFNYEYPCHSPTKKRWFLMQATPLHSNGLIEGVVIRHVDITTQKMMELQLKEYAEKDALTLLHNRRFFEEQLSEEITHTLAMDKYLSLLYIDIDDFKSINDTYGHAAGDQVLKELADEILKVTRSSDTAARIGGDEFSILLPDTNQTELACIANRLLDCIQQLNIQHQNNTIEITVSIGGKSFREGFPVSSMKEWVDKALYSAKDKGKNKVVIF